MSGLPDIHFDEFLIWKIAPIVGGRPQAKETPLVEALGYYILENEERKAKLQKEQSDIYVTHMSNRLIMEMSKANEKNFNEVSNKLSEFEEMIRPKQDHEVEKKSAADFQWDENLMKSLFKEQEKYETELAQRRGGAN